MKEPLISTFDLIVSKVKARGVVTIHLFKLFKLSPCWKSSPDGEFSTFNKRRATDSSVAPPI